MAPENFENHNTVTNEECLPNTNALTLKTDVVSSRGEKHSMLSSVSDTGAYQNDISTDSFINNREYNSSQKLGVRSDQESNERSDLRMGKRIVEDEGGDCFLDKLMIAEGALEDGWEVRHQIASFYLLHRIILIFIIFYLVKGYFRLG